MPFSLTPDDGPPRLLRFVTMPINAVLYDHDHVLAILDPDDNILWIDKAKYDTLTPEDQHLLIRTQMLISYYQTYHSGNKLAA